MLLVAVTHYDTHPRQISNYVSIAGVGLCMRLGVKNYTLTIYEVIFLYDTLLTIPQEVQYVWAKGIRRITFLYVVARLSMLLYQASYLVFLILPISSDKVCSHYL